MVGKDLYKLRARVNNTPFINCRRGGGYMSNIEMLRHNFLLAKQRQMCIFNLQYQERIRIVVSGVFVCEYIADFTYYRDGVKVYEDTKAGSITALFSIKRKLLKIVNGIDVIVVSSPNKF